jgi:very-short-patch-repair endonuclease
MTMRELSRLEETLAFQIRAASLPPPQREYRFDESPDKRRWRFDFAWPDRRFAVEVEGLTRQGGRHQTIGGFEKDAEKYHAAMLQGWTVYRCTAQLIRSGLALDLIELMLSESREVSP